MPYVVLTPSAEQTIHEEVTDSWVLAQLVVRFDHLAEHPATLTEPSVMPHRPNRLMATIRIEDVIGERWTFVALLKRLPDEEGILITSVRVGGPDYQPPV